MFSLGKHPRFMDCLTIEKAPEIIACKVTNFKCRTQQQRYLCSVWIMLCKQQGEKGLALHGHINIPRRLKHAYHAWRKFALSADIELLSASVASG